MNDFTKTELKKIKLGLLELSYVPPRLLPKIQSMIDNYNAPKQCEHLKILKGAYPRSNPPKKCETCGVLYYE